MGQKEWERLQVQKDAKEEISKNDPTFYCDLSILPQTRAWIQQLDKIMKTRQDFACYVAKNLLDLYHQKEANQKCADCGIGLEIPPTLLKPNVAPISPNKSKNLKAEEDFGFIALVPADPEAVETPNQSYIAVRVCTPCSGIHRNMWNTSRIRGCYLDGQISGIWSRGNALQAISNPLTPEFNTSNQRNYQTVEAVYGKNINTKKLIGLRNELRDLCKEKNVLANGTGKCTFDDTTADPRLGAYIRYKYQSVQCALSKGRPKSEFKG